MIYHVMVEKIYSIVVHCDNASEAQILALGKANGHRDGTDNRTMVIDKLARVQSIDKLASVQSLPLIAPKGA